MSKRWGALIAVLILCAFLPDYTAAQGSPQSGSPGSGGSSGGKTQELGQNYPNPVKIDTKIPFAIDGGASCQEPGRLRKVSLKIYNILSQFVAVPLLQPSGNVTGGEPVENLMLTCNQYVAYWDAKYSKTSQEVPAGIYLYRLEVDGRAVTKKLIVSR